MIKPLSDYTGVKAHVVFWKAHNAFTMQCLYLDDRFRAKKNMRNSFIPEKNNVVWDRSPTPPYGVVSTSDIDKFCCVDDRCIYLLPNKEANKYFDIKISYPLRHSQEDFIDSLKEWAKNWEGWNGEKPIEPRIKEYEGGVVEVVV